MPKCAARRDELLERIGEMEAEAKAKAEAYEALERARNEALAALAEERRLRQVAEGSAAEAASAPPEAKGNSGTKEGGMAKRRGQRAHTAAAF